MKKVLFGLLVLVSVNAFAADNGCKVIILSNGINSPKETVRSVLEGHGFQVTEDAAQAHFTVTSSMQQYESRSCGRNQCTVSHFSSATTVLYDGGMSQTDYFMRSALSIMGENLLPKILIQSVHHRGSNRKALRKSLEAFDAELQTRLKQDAHCEPRTEASTQ